MRVSSHKNQMPTRIYICLQMFLSGSRKPIPTRIQQQWLVTSLVIKIIKLVVDIGLIQRLEQILAGTFSATLQCIECDRCMSQLDQRGRIDFLIERRNLLEGFKQIRAS